VILDSKKGIGAEYLSKYLKPKMVIGRDESYRMIKESTERNFYRDNLRFEVIEDN